MAFMIKIRWSDRDGWRIVATERLAGVPPGQGELRLFARIVNEWFGDVYTLGRLYPLWYSFAKYCLLTASSVKRPFAASQKSFCPVR